MRRALLLSALVLSATLGVATEAVAHGDVKCEATRADRRPSVDLQKVLKAQGWTVRKILVTNGCYEVYGYDSSNRPVEVFFDPKTFERIPSR